MWPLTSNSWQKVAEGKRAQRAELLQGAKPENVDSCGAYAPFLKADASQIVENIRSGLWTASEVLEAYIARTTYAQATTNCLTEVLFHEARKEAEALDHQFAVTKEIKGKLHGVPVSFKDNYDIAGYDTTLGFTGQANRPACADADVVKAVRAEGGIPFVKTNLPQTMMFFECTNPLWGRTLNPYSPDHSSGGSSGGEAALLSMDGSALGWGTDIGGSLRIPASWSGCFALKPGFGRVSTAGAKTTVPGFESVQAVAGPMGRTVADLELASRVVFGQQGRGQFPAPIPYRTVNLPTKLRFGYYTSDCFVKASPACQRAVLETVEALKRAGHECIEFTPPDTGKAMEIFLALVSSDGFKTLLSWVGPDPLQGELIGTVNGPKLFGWMRALFAWVAESLLGDPILAMALRATKKRPVAKLWELNIEKEQYCEMFYREVWEKHQFDSIICPITAMPAFPHGAVTYLSALSASTILYNLVDSPVGSIPVTRVDPSLDGITPEWSDPKMGTGHGSPLVEGFLYKGEKAFYNVEKMAGLPVSVQIVGKQWEEEKVVEMMKVVDVALGKRGFGPGGWKKQGE